MTKIQEFSFRAQLKGQVSDFIEGLGMGCVQTTQSVVELIAELSHYEEEGKRLFPKILICDNLSEVLAMLLASSHLRIGRGPKSIETAKLALKKCAPLAQQGWSVYLERQGEDFHYGLFRDPELPTALDIRATLLDLPGEAHAMLACHVSERVVELIGPEQHRMRVHFSAASLEELSPSTAVEALVSAATRDAPERVRDSLKSYLSATIEHALLHGHGALMAVLKKGTQLPPSLATDGVILEQVIELAPIVNIFVDRQSLDSLLMLSAYRALLDGMMGSDGITVLQSDGAIVGFNFFVKQKHDDNVAPSKLIGGARRRAFEALSRSVDAEELLCAFIRSSNGLSSHKIGVQK